MFNEYLPCLEWDLAPGRGDETTGRLVKYLYNGRRLTKYDST